MYIFDGAKSTNVSRWTEEIRSILYNYNQWMKAETDGYN
jgi:hypothetical protein